MQLNCIVAVMHAFIALVAVALFCMWGNHNAYVFIVLYLFLFCSCSVVSVFVLFLFCCICFCSVVMKNGVTLVLFSSIMIPFLCLSTRYSWFLQSHLSRTHWSCAAI